MNSTIPDHLRCEKRNALGVRCSRANDHDGFTECLFRMPSDEEINSFIAGRVEAEWEACAKEADDRDEAHGGCGCGAAERIAEAIRARGAQ